VTHSHEQQVVDAESADVDVTWKRDWKQCTCITKQQR